MGHSIGSERESGQTPRGRQQHAIGVIWWAADTPKQHSVVVEAHGIRMTVVDGDELRALFARLCTEIPNVCHSPQHNVGSESESESETL